MHASIEQLLVLRDAALTPIADEAMPQANEAMPQVNEAMTQANEAMTEHVTNCAACAESLLGLKATQEQLRSLPAMAPPEDPWAQIRARAEALMEDNGPGRQAGIRRMRNWWPVGLAASLVMTALLLLQWQGGEPDAAPQFAVEKPGATQVAEQQPATSQATRDLVAESRRLEEILRSVTYQPRVVNVGTAGTIAQLEDQIALVDYGLSMGERSQLSTQESNALWRQRVELMNSLVYVRYAQAQRVDF